MRVSGLTKDQFFELHAERGDALAYDDIGLRFVRNSVVDSEVDTTTYFTRNVPLKGPYVSAAMDTVTESDMGIAMAKLGGIGIIHAGLDLDSQRKEVRRVKLAMNGLIEDPRTFHENTRLEKILQKCEKMRWDFRTFPIVDDDKKLVGLLTQNDFDFARDTSLRAKKVMTSIYEPTFTYAPSGTSIKDAYKMMSSNKKKTLPLVDSKGCVEGLYLFSDVSRIVRGNPSQYNLDDDGRLRVGAAVNSNPKTKPLERIEAMLKYGLDVVVIDSSVGDSDFVIDAIREVKSSFPGLDVMGGNISDADSNIDLIKAGVDGIKVGQGPGAICTTRRELGGGLSQASAVYECAAAVRQLKKKQRVPICADGGIVYRGDVSKAIALGADSVMMGGFLAGTDEAPVEPERRDDGTVVVSYRGMGSEAAMRDGSNRYSEDGKMPPAQGVEGVVAYKGSVNKVIRDLDGQLRKSMATCNAADIADHQNNTKVYQQTTAGMREAQPHDIQVIR